jgi:Domain of unknown function (DUF4440)
MVGHCYDRAVSTSAAAELVDRLRQTEQRRLSALVAADEATCEALHAPDYQLITPGGACLSRGDYLIGIMDGTLRYRRFDPVGDIQVRLLGTEAAALRYKVDIEVAWQGGDDVATCWHTDIYVRRDGEWQVVWSHATRIVAG